MPDDSPKANKAEWGNLIVGLIVLGSVCFAGYGKYTSDRDVQHLKTIMIEKELEVSGQRASLMEDELDVLWIDTQKNLQSIEVIRKDQERFDAAVMKFAEAVDRLSIAVAHLEEKVDK